MHIVLYILLYDKIRNFHFKCNLSFSRFHSNVIAFKISLIFTNNFRKYTVNDLDKIYDVFASDFFNVKASKGERRGETMLIIGLKDSKSGGTATKDIELNGKIYEVKEEFDMMCFMEKERFEEYIKEVERQGKINENNK